MRVGVVGAGFAGLAAAVAFRQLGHDAVVFERSAGPSTAGGAIALAPNALKCLAILGVRGISTEPWSHLPATVRSRDGRVLVARTLAELTGGGEFAAVPRVDLIAWLTAQLPPSCVRYACGVRTVGADGTIVVDGGRERFDLVIGADGSRSAVREALWPDAAGLRPTGITGWAWIVESSLTAGFGSIWGRTADFGILPLVDGRTYVYGGTSRGDDLTSFCDWPDPLPALIDAANPKLLTTPEIFERRPPRKLSHGKVVLIGDAAHTMRPTFGQGAALAMEDAITLAYRGVSGLSRRRPRMLAMYGLSKAGSYLESPRTAPVESVRNWALDVVPDPVFGTLAGTVSVWRPRWADTPAA